MKTTMQLHALSVLLLLLGLACTVFAAEQQWTMKHEEGRCAMRGHCGKQGFFGSQLPCPDNGLAEEPSSSVREKLVGICGDKWSEGAVCCKEEQIDALSSNLKTAERLISACPACKENFFNLFCTFTCSPDQSLFVNVTNMTPKGDNFLVTELDQLVSIKYKSGFFDSCKDVKVGATGGRAMDLIGGGATNYSRFVKFLGDKKPFGSPFQINFPEADEDEFPGMHTRDLTAFPCNSTDERYKCACVDCDAACPALPEVAEAEECRVGALPCLSFAIILIYSVFLALLITAVSGHVAYAKHNNRKNERLRLLQDVAPSDDEDEGDIVRHAGMLDKPQKSYPINTICDRAFSRLGKLCARWPGITVGTSIIVVALLSLGWLRFELETDPVRLWVAPNSDAAREKEFFDSNFGPFFRTEQAFLVNDTNPDGPGPVLSYDTLQWWFDVESRVERMKSMQGYTLDDVCYKPTGDACVVQSLSGYFGGPSGGVSPSDWASTIKDCTDNPGDVTCLPEFKQPIQPKYILGPYNQSVFDAEALIVTWVVTNADKGSAEEQRAMDWEESLKNVLLAIKGEARDRGLRLSFTTESSLEEELNKSTNTDAKIVAISYLIMFLYASISLGSTTLTVRSLLRNPMNALVQSKFSLGVIGIVIVLMSVSASVGLFAAAGIKATLIIAEVIPFLVLAVGVDNIFLIVHEFERVNISHADEAVEDRISRALGRMGPSILLSALTETVAFALGSAVGMPAVRNFAAYAAGAVFINAILQVTMFISVLTWNQQRVEAGRADCFPCARVSRADPPVAYDGFASYSGGVEEEGVLQRFIRKRFAPSLLGNRSKVAVVTIFLGIFTAGLALFPSVELGLDQRIAIPSDSYLIKYFDDLYDYFNGGPPVYFVTRSLNVTQRSHQQELCGRFSTCNDFSLANVLEQERKRPEVSYIADATASWVDDFFTWLNPSLDCCIDGAHGETCFANRNPPWNVTLSGMPEGQEFVSYAQRWVAAPTDEDCPLGGKAPYSNALVIDNSSLTIPASHFRTAHTALHSQSDFISAYKSARRIATDISERNNIDVFPYSKFYIFFDQYLSIVRLAGALIGGALAFILVLSSLLLGSIATGLVVTVTVAMTLTAIIGTMALAGVALNALTLVNLVICVGISVEFCAHIARAFSVPSSSLLERTQLRGKDARAFAALVNVGGSVFSGIGVTKLLGVVVLAFTRSKIFEIYYFRVWLALVVWAALHALVLLPVLLSWFGGRGYSDPEGDGGLEQDLASRRYRALIPDEEYDSEEY